MLSEVFLKGNIDSFALSRVEPDKELTSPANTLSIQETKSKGHLSKKQWNLHSTESLGPSIALVKECLFPESGYAVGMRLSEAQVQARYRT